MRRPTIITLAVLLAVSMTAIPFATATGANVYAQEEPSERDDEAIAPGEMLAGVAAAQEAEVNGELAERTFGIQLARAQTENAMADVVADRLTDVETRLDDLEARADAVNESYEAGEISHGQYAAEMAAMETDRRTAERLANATQAVADGLDEELLAERGVDAEAIQTLADRAAELGGEEVAAIARSIAGQNVGQPVDADREPGAPIDLPDGADRAPAPADAPGGTSGEDGADDADDTDDDGSSAEDDRRSGNGASPRY